MAVVLSRLWSVLIILSPLLNAILWLQIASPLGDVICNASFIIVTDTCVPLPAYVPSGSEYRLLLNEIVLSFRTVYSTVSCFFGRSVCVWRNGFSITHSLCGTFWVKL